MMIRLNVPVSTVSLLFRVHIMIFSWRLGYIQCRFPPGMQHIQELGRFLKDRRLRIMQEKGGDAYSESQETGNMALYFIVMEQYRENFAQQVAINENVLDNMILYGKFTMGQVKFTISNKLSKTKILLSFSGDDWSPISGFPRMLQRENKKSSKL